jgi:hypothetical protein
MVLTKNDEKNILENIERLQNMGKNDKKIIDEYVKFYTPEKADFVKKNLTKIKKNIKQRSAFIDEDELIRREEDIGTTHFEILSDNKKWNEGRREIKYLTVKPKTEKILNVKVVMKVDKTGRRMEIKTDFFTDQLTAKMKREIAKVFNDKADELIKNRKLAGISIKDR